jgi:hypothetical protein
VARDIVKGEWLTTAPNPRSSATGVNAGQTGWKRHFLEVPSSSETFERLGLRRAICGVRPMHGWSSDLFIEDRCQRCLNRVERETDHD